ncbi:hypothetical protein C8A05DRAFT_44178 [Staphylotrichum tortipilum]|uniref:Uncharacterized protein n=1 Tax=Staphylotrichum tortipilum TaxID=2831512 RepID=A0AAN6MKZ1_9PEZI|nr:hypothetical protein C8A05DRAFT_44178 [Staphylotrichum longicolle]
MSVTQTLAHPPPPHQDAADKELEKAVSQKIREARPGQGTTTSSIRSVFEESGTQVEPEADMLAGLKRELHTTKEAFGLSNVPKSAYALGLAGTLPYLATSLSTVFLSWNLQHGASTHSAILSRLFLDHDAALDWIHTLEPIQIGYGAAIISVLGLVHWGMQFAHLPQHPPESSRKLFRFTLGVLGPAMALPSLSMPIEWALTSQFAAFCALYLADAHATVRGWVPSWYASYRFVLTGVVGGAIFLSLVGRATFGADKPRLSKAELRESLAGKDAVSGGEGHDWAREEQEERERVKDEVKRVEHVKKAQDRKEEKKKAGQVKKQE